MSQLGYDTTDNVFYLKNITSFPTPYAALRSSEAKVTIQSAPSFNKNG